LSRIEKILRKQKERELELIQNLELVKKQLTKLGAIKIFLFGSLNTGMINRYSDIDVLVIMPSMKSGKEWMNEIYENLESEVKSDIIAYNEVEFKEELPKNSFLKNVVSEGKLLYERK
jgi:predicted nucleotidyltransferase